jgi:metal-responsive CopG/Arc/MetJ family transcriptional regulator
MATVEQKTSSEGSSKTMRTSVSFPRELYETLEKIAQEKKVSVAWVVRDAAEKYVTDKWPLFGRSE